MKNKHPTNHGDTKKTPAELNEFQVIIDQWCDLRQQGKYNEAAELWTKSRKKDETQNKEITDRIKNIRQPPFANSKYRKPFLTLIVLFSIFLFGGMILEATIGKNFIFAWADTYGELAAKIYFALLLITAIVNFIFLRKDPYIRSRYPTKEVRWIFLFPLLTCVFAALPLIAPLGWAALSGWAVGSYADNLDARIISVEQYNQSARTHCTRHAKLEFRGNSARICTDGLIIGNIPQPNEKILIAGQVSWLGVYIQQIKTQTQ